MLLERVLVTTYLLIGACFYGWMKGKGNLDDLAIDKGAMFILCIAFWPFGVAIELGYKTARRRK